MTQQCVNYSQPQDDAPSAPVVVLRPLHKEARNTVKEKSPFHKAFLAAAKGEGEGCLLQYLYHDTLAESWGSTTPPPGAPWDNLSVSDNFTTWKQQASALTHALRNGLADSLAHTICYNAYAPGEHHAVEANDFILIDSLQRAGKEISGVISFDILDRYAYESARKIYEKFNLYTLGYPTDILLNGEKTILRAKKEFDLLRSRNGETTLKATPLVAVFGGLLQNVQKMTGQNGDQEITAQYEKIIDLHGKNTHLIMTVDAQNNAGHILDNYKYSQELEAFVLNFLPRAIEEGIILNQDYNVFNHWKMADLQHANKNTACSPLIWDDEQKALLLYAECKRDHTIKTPDEDLHFKVGDLIPVTRTRKGPIEDHVDMLRKAGFKEINVYEQPHQPHKVIHAAVKPSSP